MFVLGFVPVIGLVQIFVCALASCVAPKIASSARAKSAAVRWSGVIVFMGFGRGRSWRFAVGS